MAAENRIDEEDRQIALTVQRNELTEHHVYTRLAGLIKDEHNSRVLREIADDELRHYQYWSQLSGQESQPNRWRVWWYVIIAKVFGITFGMRLLENGEAYAHEVAYKRLVGRVPGVEAISRDEERHEERLIGLIDEERLQYVGAVVLGLNDALVELTGTLAGLTFALQNSRLIAVSGLVTGIAASLSMAASGYLSAREDADKQDPFTSALYTGAAYVLAVVLLVVPFLLLSNPYGALLWTGLNAVLLILVFNYYVAVARNVSFRKRFMEMAGISLGVAVISFALGYVVRVALGIEV